MPDDLTTNELAVLLGVTRRTIERAIESKTLVPSSRTASGRARFSQRQAEELENRADAARIAGYKYVIDAVMTPGPVLGPRRNRKAPPPTTAQWLRKTMWKRQNIQRDKAPTPALPPPEYPGSRFWLADKERGKRK
jgi:excisionase family DNA binding protein